MDPTGANSVRPFKKLDDTKLVPAQFPKMTSKIRTGSVSSLSSVEARDREVGGEVSSLDEDEIPLHKIRVRTETAIEWDSSKA